MASWSVWEPDGGSMGQVSEVSAGLAGCSSALSSADRDLVSAVATARELSAGCVTAWIDAVVKTQDQLDSGVSALKVLVAAFDQYAADVRGLAGEAAAARDSLWGVAYGPVQAALSGSTTIAAGAVIESVQDLVDPPQPTRYGPMGHVISSWSPSPVRGQIASAVNALVGLAYRRQGYDEVFCSDVLTALNSAGVLFGVSTAGNPSPWPGVCVVSDDVDLGLVGKLKGKLQSAGTAAGLTAAEIDRAANDIAAMVANSPEPYKSLFYQHIDQTSFTGLTADELAAGSPAYYIGGGQVSCIHLNFQQLLQDRPPYYTFFHEFGHAIDDQEGTSGWKTTGFKYGGVPLYTAMRDDVKNNIAQTIAELAAKGSIKSISPTDRDAIDAIAQAYIDHDTDVIDKLPPDVSKALYTHYASSEKGGLGGGDARTAGDIYNGITRDLIPSLWTHGSDYWGDDPEGPAKKELWAGFYADQMVNQSQVCPPGAMTPNSDKINLPVTTALFPSASQALAAMAQLMKDT